MTLRFGQLALDHLGRVMDGLGSAVVSHLSRVHSSGVPMCLTRTLVSYANYLNPRLENIYHLRSLHSTVHSIY